MSEWIWVQPPGGKDSNTGDTSHHIDAMNSIRWSVEFGNRDFTIFADTEHLLLYTINWAHPMKGRLFAYVHQSLLETSSPER